MFHSMSEGKVLVSILADNLSVYLLINFRSLLMDGCLVSLVLFTFES